MIGTSLSHYRIVEKLVEGGMGVVCRARDTNLDRQVAVKVLPDIFSSDPERLARFERETRLLASLDHPNIATIHGLEQADGKRFLVLELVEAETLARRIVKGPLPLKDALDVCRQITEGLEAAHEKGVIHRDLKPANIQLTAGGKVKILDFGLARAFHDHPSDLDQAQSPTITAAMTRPGAVLGTVAYISPEQAEGEEVDARSAAFALGVVLGMYERGPGHLPSSLRPARPVARGVGSLGVESPSHLHELSTGRAGRPCLHRRGTPTAAPGPSRQSDEKSAGRSPGRDKAAVRSPRRSGEWRLDR